MMMMTMMTMLPTMMMTTKTNNEINTILDDFPDFWQELGIVEEILR